jgi:serine phosphatase RsbU (regulator of sigma subunit)
VTSFPRVDLVRFFWLPYIVGLAYLAIGFWINRVRGNVASSRVFAIFCSSAALATGLYFDLVSTHVLSALWTAAISFLGGSLFVLGLIFPEESKGNRSRFVRYLPYALSFGLAVWGVLVLGDFSNPWAYVDPWRFSYIYASLGIFFFIGVMFYHRFSHNAPAIQQQARIVLWGSLIAFTPIALWMLAPNFGLNIPWNPGVFLPFLIAFPISIATAILRYKLWDIDVIINRTLVYGLLTVVLVLIYLATVLVLQRTFQTLTGERSDLAAVVSTLVLVALFVPIRRYVQDFVDRRFYRRRYDAVRTVDAFSTSLRDEVDLDRVISRLESVVHETILPSLCSTWLSDEAGFRIYRPEVGSIKRASMAGDIYISQEDQLVEHFRSGPGAIGLEQLEIGSIGVGILLEGGYRLAVPLITHGELIGWLGLGSRLSEQKFSSDDKVLLSRLAMQVAPTVRVAQLAAEQQAEAIERERLDQELLVASRIQTGLLPKELPQFEGWHLAAFYQPAREVGGDFYEFEYFEDGRLGIFVGDVTDKGIPAALVMATTRTLLKAAAAEIHSPGKLLAQVNNLLIADIPENMFVTCFYAILNPKDGHLMFANAGHNLPFRLTNREVLEIKAAGMPLGLMPDMAYDVHEIMVEPGDELIFFSDGLVEARNAEKEMFGAQRLKNLFAGYPGGERTLIDYLMLEMEKFTGAEQEQEDDITIVGIKRDYNAAGNQQKEHTSLWELSS